MKLLRTILVLMVFAVVMYCVLNGLLSLAWHWALLVGHIVIAGISISVAIAAGSWLAFMLEQLMAPKGIAHHNHFDAD